ncbi:MAG: acyl-CoA thioester hydrolase [Variibacter sp.]|nr:acyl-CoA thioester hydrolase [Variibacter sp.]
MSNTLVRKEPPPQLSEFPHLVEDNVRLGDLDHQNHVNNAVFATFLETGRVMLLRDLFGEFRGEGAGFVLARVEIDYLRELHWPGRVVIATRVARLGNSSVTFAQGVFNGGECAARGQSTLVRIDLTTRRSIPFTEDMASQLRTKMGNRGA